ncbi:MAG: ribonuclease E/G [Clostridiales bacterium]|nr:ribonuclease E/G [Clostridiales bacterium]
MQDNEKGKILVLKLYNKLFSILIRNRDIIAIQAQDVDDSDKNPASSIGNIYVGKVKNISANIGAAFVEIKKGELAFLPLDKAKNAVILNRKGGGIKAGDELLVQLDKEPVKTKLAGVTAELSLSGSYVVVKCRRADNASLEVSSKLGKKYHQMYKSLEPLKEIAKRFDIIVRTNAAEADDISVVTDEAEKLAAQMEHILSVGDKRTCFTCLYQTEPEYLAFVKNCYQSEYDEIITDEKEIYDRLIEYAALNPSNVKFYEDEMLPLYKLYSIEARISELLNKKVWLKSGAYLVIENTEALIAIDVNTGKYETKKKNQEETCFKINMKAAEAIAKALRARNLAGMILVDFINMNSREHTQELMEYMKSLLKKDSVPSSVVDITGLGLMEITRKKKNKSFAEQMKDKES